MSFVPFSEFKANAGNRQMRRHAGALIRVLEPGVVGDPNVAGVEWIVRRGHEPPPHRHAHEDEAVFIVSGDVEFRLGTQTVEIGQGNWLFLPRGVEHSYRVLSDQVRMLAMYAPSGIEMLFHALSEPVADDQAGSYDARDPFDGETAREMAHRYGLTFSGNRSAAARTCLT